MTTHYVYRLFDPATNALLYIGRSLHPDRRQRAFTKRTGITVTLGKLEAFDGFEAAKHGELKAIAENWPPYNRKLQSSRGNLGIVPSAEHRQKVSEANKGRKMTETQRADYSRRFKGKVVSAETRAKLSASKMGQKPTDEARKNMSLAGKGKPKSAEHRAKIAAAHMGKKHSPEHRQAVLDGRARKKIQCRNFGTTTAPE